jgi:hypothetical protein
VKLELHFQEHARPKEPRSDGDPADALTERDFGMALTTQESEHGVAKFARQDALDGASYERLRFAPLHVAIGGDSRFDLVYIDRGRVPHGIAMAALVSGPEEILRDSRDERVSPRGIDSRQSSRDAYESQLCEILRDVWWQLTSEVSKQGRTNDGQQLIDCAWLLRLSVVDERGYVR